MIRAIREGLAGDSLKRISGILNGTCNYMLTRMEAERISFDAVLADAQAKGFAEADPTDDLDGYDARAKLCVLARIGLHVALRPDDVPCRSIRPLKDVDFVYARRLGYTIRQVSRVEHNGDRNGLRSVDAAVEPALVKNDSVLSRVRGSEESRAHPGRARLRTRLLRPRRRRRSDGGRGPLRRPLDRRHSPPAGSAKSPTIGPPPLPADAGTTQFKSRGGLQHPNAGDPLADRRPRDGQQAVAIGVAFDHHHQLGWRHNFTQLREIVPIGVEMIVATPATGDELDLDTSAVWARADSGAGGEYVSALGA